MSNMSKCSSDQYLEYLLKSISRCEKITENREKVNGIDENRIIEQTKCWLQQLRYHIEMNPPISWVVRVDVYEDENQMIERIKYQYDPNKPYYEMASIVIYQRDLDSKKNYDES